MSDFNKEQQSKVTLDWAGPFTWIRGEDRYCVFDASVCNRNGIYIFSVPFHGSYLPYYVGQTGRSFAIRLQEHTKEYLSGVYRTYDPDEFIKGRKKIIWDGLWKKDRRNLWPELLESYVELAPIIYAFLSCFSLFLAPLEVDRLFRHRIESSIGIALREHNELTRIFFDDAVKYYVNKSNLTPVTIVNNVTENILGLKKEIVA